MLQGAISFCSLDDQAIGPGCVAEHLEDFGVVLFFDATRESLASAMASWTVLFRHPHAAPDGLTVLRPVEGSGGAGFSNAAIGLHTDRAQIADPPTVVAVLVERPAEVGGDSLLVDAASDRALLLGAVQTPERLVLCDAEDGRRPVVEQHGGRVRVRYRNDALARPLAVDEAGEVVLSRLHSLLKVPRVLRLGAGCGYVLHNHRVLHGRTAFAGPRTAVRLLANIAPQHPYENLNDGFTM
jgi:alpha-ketoglutarate-dependent taurine dioxygenase